MVSTLSINTTPNHCGAGRISPNQYHDAGYRDGYNRTRNYKVYLRNSDYQKGWNLGRRSNPANAWYNPNNEQYHWSEA
jgi:hypothetical protein